MSNSTSSLALQLSLSMLEYVLLYVPTLILDGLYVAALVRTGEINLKMKVLLINNLVPDVMITIMATLDLTLLPARVYTSSVAFRKVTCVMTFVMVISGQVGNTLAPPFFAIGVYVFIKYGVKKLKWYAIVGFITVSSVIILIAAVTQAAASVESAISLNGYCVLSSDVSAGAALATIILYLGYAVILIVCVCVTITLAIANYCYVRSNTISQDSESSSPIKRALAKVLAFETSKLLFLLVQVIVVSTALTVGSPLRETFFGHLLATSYGASTLLTPIMSIVFLMPIRDALKQMFKPTLYCLFRKGASVNRVAPESAKSEEVESQL